MNKLWIPALSAVALTLGCSSQTDDSSRAAGPASAPVLENPTPPAAAPASLSGKVAETMDSGGYTYVLIDTGSEKVWAATTGFPVAVGDEVVVEAPMAMPGWHSDALDRTFDLVYFSESIHPPGEVLAVPGSPKPPPSTNADVSGIEKAEGGVVVEEVFRKREDLVGTEIAVRGKVVKYNEGILGKNWLHIQDGTGAEGTNDLTITTDAEAAVGDVVLIRGTLVADRDFGFGYAYELIVEDAKVTVE